jgi:hypothetical protein
MVAKLLLTGRMHLLLNALFNAFHKYVNCDYSLCSLIKINSDVLDKPTVLHVSQCIVVTNKNLSLLSPLIFLSGCVRCICHASLLLCHSSSVSMGFWLVSYHLGKASQPCKFVSCLDYGHEYIQTDYVDLAVSFIQVFYSFLRLLTTLKTVVLTKSRGCVHALRPR